MHLSSKLWFLLCSPENLLSRSTLLFVIQLLLSVKHHTTFWWFLLISLAVIFGLRYLLVSYDNQPKYFGWLSNHQNLARMESTFLWCIFYWVDLSATCVAVSAIKLQRPMREQNIWQNPFFNSESLSTHLLDINLSGMTPVTWDSEVFPQAVRPQLTSGQQTT